MIEIPEAVKEAARAAYLSVAMKSPDDDWTNDEVREVAIAAILAERQRCAEVARNSRHTYAIIKLTLDKDGKPIETPAGRGGPGADIADAILA